jgi:hypothetical protein
MKRTVWWSLAVLAMVGMILMEADLAHSTSELCPMGGVMVKTVTVKEKALDWAKNLQNAAVEGADIDVWSVLALSRADQGIAMLVGPGYVFFGVAGRGGEVYPKDIEKAFGKDLRKLREAVKKEINELWKAGVVQIEGGDVQKISDAVGRGLLEKEGRDWVLKTTDCQAVDLPASGL